eukprot:3832536-Heterocapsa_arctica.AAC.1
MREMRKSEGSTSAPKLILRRPRTPAARTAALARGGDCPSRWTLRAACATPRQRLPPTWPSTPVEGAAR